MKYHCSQTPKKVKIHCFERYSGHFCICFLAVPIFVPSLITDLLDKLTDFIEVLKTKNCNHPTFQRKFDHLHNLIYSLVLLYNSDFCLLALKSISQHDTKMDPWITAWVLRIFFLWKTAQSITPIWKSFSTLTF